MNVFSISLLVQLSPAFLAQTPEPAKNLKVHIAPDFLAGCPKL